MKKVMQCKSAPEIELCMEDGTKVLFRFNMQMLANVQEFEGGFKDFLKKSPAEMTALILYAAGKDINEDFTLETARMIASSMDVKTATEIIDTFNESVGADTENPDQKKMLMEMLKSIST